MKYQRILGGVLSVFMLAGVAAGCNQGQTSSGSSVASSGEDKPSSSASSTAGEKPAKLTAIIDNDSVGIIQPGADLLKEQEGIETDLIVQSYDQTYTKIMTSVMGGTPVDAISCDSVWTAEFTEAGMIISIDDYISDELKSDLFPAFVEQSSYKGKLMALPQTAQAKWLYYNTDMLKQAGFENPPKTWDELFEMGNAIKDKGLCKYPVAWAAKQAEGLVCDFTVATAASGGALRDANGNWTLNSEGAVNGLKLIVDSIKNGNADPGSVNYTDREVLNPFMAGDVPFVLNWAFAYALANDPQESKISGNVGIALIPSNKEGVVSASVTGGGGFAIPVTSQNPEYAWKLLENVLNRDALFQSAKDASNAPPILSMYKDEEFVKEFPTMNDCYPQYEYAVARPSLAKYSEWSNKMQVSIHEAVTGSKSVEDVLNEMQNNSESYK